MFSLKRRSIIGTGVMFASNGALFASLLPWYPTLMRSWGLTEATFGLIVACFPLGSILSAAVPAPIVKRFGPRATVVAGTVAMAAILTAGGGVSSGWALAGLLLVLGFLDPIVDVAQNVTAVRVQDAVGFSIMSSVHAAWSLGAASGGALAAMAVGKLPLALHLGLAATAVTAVALLGTMLVGPVPAPEEDTDQQQSTSTKRAILLVIPIVAIAIGGAVVEEVASNWAALAAHQLAGVPLSATGIALSLMLTAQCVGRFAGDPMINRWGRVAVARVGGVLIAVGGIIAISSTAPLPLFIGFVLAGFGCATIVPSAFVAAARIPGISEGAGLTMVSWLMRIGFLTASPVIGAVASASSLRVALGIVVLGGVTIMALSPQLAGSGKDR
ncbi:MFS transporter [Corynebacterium hindlerae]|nr:MFS transporter [Corynebacterium hindlerae]